MRDQTGRGTINMNTNASLPKKVEILCKTGLDSIRVSLNSVRKEFYQRYYQPHGYLFEDVQKSISVAKNYKKFVSLNYLVMPGFTDEEEECEELIGFVRKNAIDMIQWRNLNFDPHRYFLKMVIGAPKRLLGISTVMARLCSKFPRLKHGYFNLPKEDF
ncbi:MAG: radical SAM protein [Candidatus Omnitrophica bacterium]|nr:radical SAM protein [Candidatus Omnitrophota bacterium]